MKAGKMNKVFHRDFLGAHRYTTIGGTVRSAEGGLRFASVGAKQRSPGPHAPADSSCLPGAAKRGCCASPPVLSHLPFFRSAEA